MTKKEESIIDKDRSRTAATSKTECFVIIVNNWRPLTIITKGSILGVAAVLDPPLIGTLNNYSQRTFRNENSMKKPGVSRRKTEITIKALNGK